MNDTYVRVLPWPRSFGIYYCGVCFITIKTKQSPNIFLLEIDFCHRMTISSLRSSPKLWNHPWPNMGPLESKLTAKNYLLLFKCKKSHNNQPPWEARISKRPEKGIKIRYYPKNHPCITSPTGSFKMARLTYFYECVLLVVGFWESCRQSFSVGFNAKRWCSIILVYGRCASGF